MPSLTGLGHLLIRLPSVETLGLDMLSASRTGALAQSSLLQPRNSVIAVDIVCSSRAIASGYSCDGRYFGATVTVWSVSGRA